MSSLPSFAKTWLEQRRAGAAAVEQIENAELRSLTGAEALRQADAVLSAAPFQVMTADRQLTLCRSAGFSFCFIGGLAVQRWGQPRMTADIDLTIITGFGGEDPSGVAAPPSETNESIYARRRGKTAPDWSGSAGSAAASTGRNFTRYFVRS